MRLSTLASLIFWIRSLGLVSGAPGASPRQLSRRDDGFKWNMVPLAHAIPKESLKAPPSPLAFDFDRIQYDFAARVSENDTERTTRLERRNAVRDTFLKDWSHYKSQAWGADEVRPVSGGQSNAFGGWAATMVDALDTLWIMGEVDEFNEVMDVVKDIDFGRSTVDEISVFETNIRFLGGLLGAYDVSGGADGPHSEVLLRKAVEVGDMLYLAFDTENHLPVLRWPHRHHRESTNGDGRRLRPLHQMSLEVFTLAELGSMSLEFTRLSQAAGDPKYYDAIARVTEFLERMQDKSMVPGLWPPSVSEDMRDTHFTIGAMADSAYEYLPKMHFLLGGADDSYRSMYIKAVEAMKVHIFYTPATPDEADIMLSGDFHAGDGGAHADGGIEPHMQHLSCFSGGMVALASRRFRLPDDMEYARRLVDGCLWGYEKGPSGILPERSYTTKCDSNHGAEPPCRFNETKWLDQVRLKNLPHGDGTDPKLVASREHLPAGITKWADTRYSLRPETVESLFVMYRLTGDPALMDRGWRMWEAITRHTASAYGHSELGDVTGPDPSASAMDRTESFWFAETLKYFYLLFSDPHHIDLDEFVLNTEAHPFRYPRSPIS